MSESWDWVTSGYKESNDIGNKAVIQQRRNSTER